MSVSDTSVWVIYSARSTKFNAIHLPRSIGDVIICEAHSCDFPAISKYNSQKQTKELELDGNLKIVFQLESHGVNGLQERPRMLAPYEPIENFHGMLNVQGRIHFVACRNHRCSLGAVPTPPLGSFGSTSYSPASSAHTPPLSGISPFEFGV